MHFPAHPQSHPKGQLSLFEAFMVQPPAPLFQVAETAGEWAGVGAKPEQPEFFSEMSLRGSAGSCLNLLAPMLRELSEEQDARWLTLIDPPSSLTQAWLRDAGLNRERILLLKTRGAQNALQLACEALKLGKSHTVVSWVNPLNASARQQLTQAARLGAAQSLNIRLG